MITVTSVLPGANTNYSLSTSSSSSDGFSPASFSVGLPSGGALSGGNGASPGTAYSVSLAYAPNGNVLSANDSVNGNWTYGYDDFNRLVWSNKNSGQQTYSFVYDRFGNRWQQNAPQGGSVFLATFNAGNNRIDGVNHDASGNVTRDPTTGNNYTYDAENRITQVNGGAGSGGVTYTYDADGQRVEKNVNGVKTDYLYDESGHAIAELSGSGTVNRQELFAGGKHLGTYVSGTSYFSHGDWLGTERARSDMTGAACETIQSLPYGDGQITSGTCGDPSTRHFTGKERDIETNLDYFGARYYANGMGQFITPDWAAKATAVPYAEFADPQSLNLYSYVRDLPTARIDTDGHGMIDPRTILDAVNHISPTAAQYGKALGIEVANFAIGKVNELTEGALNPLHYIVPRVPTIASGTSGPAVAAKVTVAVVPIVIAPETAEAEVVDMTAAVRSQSMVFRGTELSPDIAFTEGFKASGTNTDLLEHAFGSGDSAFVSTSKSFEQAAGFGSNIYVIRPVNGIDINEALGPVSPFPLEQEVAIPWRIEPNDVRAVTNQNQGISILNPNYKP